MSPILELVNATLIRGRTRVLEWADVHDPARASTQRFLVQTARQDVADSLLTLDDRPRASDNGVPALRLFGREHWDVGELRTHLGVVTGDLDATFGLSTSGGRVSGLDTAVSVSSAATASSPITR
jgi:hypothetical protein